MNSLTTTEEFFKLIAKEQYVLLDAFGVWCGPCKIIAPLLEQLSIQYESISFVKIDIDVLPQITQIYNIRSIPVLILFKDGQEIARQVGAVPKKQLEEFLNKYIEQENKGYEEKEIEFSATKSS